MDERRLGVGQIAALLVAVALVFGGTLAGLIWLGRPSPPGGAASPQLAENAQSATVENPGAVEAPAPYSTILPPSTAKVTRNRGDAPSTTLVVTDDGQKPQGFDPTFILPEHFAWITVRGREWERRPFLASLTPKAMHDFFRVISALPEDAAEALFAVSPGILAGASADNASLVIVLRFTGPVRSSLLDPLIGRRRVKKYGDRFWHVGASLAYHVDDDSRTVTITEPALIERLFDPTTRPPLRDRLRAVDKTDLFAATLDYEQASGLQLLQAAVRLPAGFEPAGGSSQVVSKHIKQIDVRVREDLGCEFVLEAHDLENAQALAAKLRVMHAGFLSLVDSFVDEMAARPTSDQVLRPARAALAMVRDLKLEENGLQVTVRLAPEALAIEHRQVQEGWRLFFADHLSRESRRRQLGENLKRVNAALAAYHKRHRRWPAPSTRNASGEPLLSWRVTLLPFLGEQALHDEFHHDEPWNSPHNERLLQRMPRWYAPTVGESAGKTTMHLCLGSGGCYAVDPPRLEAVRARASDTVLLVNVAKSLAVPWTSPGDFTPEGLESWPRSLSQDPEGVWLGFADSTVRWFRWDAEGDHPRRLFWP